MDELIRQIRNAIATEQYYLALFGALTLPDILGALGSENGSASASKYKAWLRDNAPTLGGDAEGIYGLRCSLLHQGRAKPHGGGTPVAFMYPSGEVSQIHNLSLEVNGERVGWYSIPMFIDEITKAAEKWLADYGETATVQRNLEKFARLRPEGLPPHVVGAPVIA